MSSSAQNNLAIEKTTLERLQDNIRSRYACAFAAENKLVPHYDSGSIKSGYVRSKEGAYDTHSNGVAVRFSVLGCKKGKIIWITESKDLLAYTVEIRNLAGEVEFSFIYQAEEIHQLLEIHLLEADRTHAINHFKNEIEALNLQALAKEYKNIRKIVNRKEADSFDPNFLRLTILEHGLSEKLSELVEVAFDDRGEIGKSLYLHILKSQVQKELITWPIYWTAWVCVASGFTFINKIKKLTIEAIELDKKLPPTHPDYKIWLEETALLSCYLIDQIEKRADSKQEKIEKHRIVELAKK